MTARETSARGRRIGCWVIGSLAVLVMLLAALAGAVSARMVRAGAARQKPRVAAPLPPIFGLPSPDTTHRFVTVQGAPLPPLPPDAVHAAIAFYGHGLRMLRKSGNRSALARGQAYLATLHAAVGEDEEAERLFREAKTVLQKDPDSYLAWVHNNHGLVQMNRGQYPNAIESFRAAAAIVAEQELRGVALHNLATAYTLLGDPEQAESVFLEVLELFRSIGKEGSHRAQIVRTELAIFYARIGDFEAAQSLLEALAAEPRLRRSTRVLVLQALGHVLYSRREFAKAEARLAEAQSLTREGTYGHVWILADRTAMYNRAGRLDDAQTSGEQAYRAVVSLYGEQSTAAAGVLVELGFVAMRRGELAKADGLLTRASAIFSRQGGDGEALIRITRASALVAHQRNQSEHAHALSRQALDLSKEHLARILAFGSEAQRLAYQREAVPFDQLASLGEPNLLAEAVLTMKGAVLDSLLYERVVAHASAPADQAHLDRINGLKRAIMEMVGRGERDTAVLERDLKSAETALAQKIPRQARRDEMQVDVARVQEKLEPDQVLVEIVRYQQYRESGDIVAYGGVVIPPRGAPVWVPLGEAGVVEENIDSLVGQFGGGRSMDSPDGPRADVQATLRDLHERLWKPLVKAFPARVRKVLLSPDGSTSFLPWAALIDSNGAFLAERWQLTQIGSGRDLLRTARRPSATSLVAMGDGAGNLQYSRAEVEYVAQTARRHGWSVTKLLGAQAREHELVANPRPGILHLATHGGRLPAGVARVVQTRLSRNPMYRGYLVLGGGTQTLDAWTRGSMEPFANDGILTAEESSTLDLRGTWLTVLSACQTGAGDVRPGEGVMGLRRGFALAGTESLVVSLWPVEDYGTAEFMKAFYDRLFLHGDLSEAFYQAQVAELVRWRKRDGVLIAVYRAGGFVLTR